MQTNFHSPSNKRAQHIWIKFLDKVKQRQGSDSNETLPIPQPLLLETVSSFSSHPYDNLQIFHFTHRRNKKSYH